MGNLCSNIDWNDTLAYPTLKIVRVRDWRLGFLKYALMLGVVLYIAIYALYMQKGYLDKEVPVGTVYTSLQRPSPDAVQAFQFPYCNTSNNLNNSNNHYDKLPCKVWPANKILYPLSMTNQMFITTRVSKNIFGVSSSCEHLFAEQNATCKGWADHMVHKGKKYYLAGISKYTIKVTHAMLAVKHFSETGQQRFSVEDGAMNGWLIDQNKKKIAHFPKGKGAIMSIGQILQAGNVDLSQPDNNEGGGTKAGETMRHGGVTLFFVIKYDNTKSPGDLPEFKMYVNRIHKSEAKSTEVIHLNDTHWLERDRHGVKLVFVQSGSIGRFNFQTLLIALVSSLALLSVATFVVDMLMLYACKDRENYARNKYHETENFAGNPYDVL